jgi:hypothetical protein
VVAVRPAKIETEPLTRDAIPVVTAALDPRPML